MLQGLSGIETTSFIIFSKIIPHDITKDPDKTKEQKKEAFGPKCPKSLGVGGFSIWPLMI